MKCEIMVLPKTKYVHAHIEGLHDQYVLASIPEPGIPFHAHEHLAFVPGEQTVISYTEGSRIFTLTTCFTGYKQLSEKETFKFHILEMAQQDNIRKESRIETDIAGILMMQDTFQMVDILDISEAGMKIRTAIPLTFNPVIAYQFAGSKHQEGIIQWDQEVNDQFVYGLSFR